MTFPNGRTTEILIQRMDDETLVYDLSSDRALCLNETSAMVWELCDGKTSPAQIADKMSVKLKTLVSEDFVLLALDELGTMKLLENPTKSRIYLGGVSRREMIRRAGMASMAALPAIVAISAPKAVNAQSGGVVMICNPGPCTTVAQCITPCAVCFGVTGSCSAGATPCSPLGSACGGGPLPGTCMTGVCSAPGGVCPPGSPEGSPCFGISPGGTCIAVLGSGMCA